MSDVIKIANFDGEVKGKNLVLPDDVLEILNELNIKSVKVELSAATEDMISKLGINFYKFERIKNVQSLPENVAIDFLLCRGVLNKNDFLNRIKKFDEK